MRILLRFYFVVNYPHGLKIKNNYLRDGRNLIHVSLKI